MSISIKGTLPVIMAALFGQTTVKTKSVIMFQLTTGEFIDAQAGIKEGQYVSIAELAAITRLIDENGQHHNITYEMLSSTSRQNFKYLQNLKDELDAKEQAES